MTFVDDGIAVASSQPVPDTRACVGWQHGCDSLVPLDVDWCGKCVRVKRARRMIGVTVPRNMVDEQPALLPAIDENDETIVNTLIAKRTPEPSGAYDRGYHDGSEATARELIACQERDNRLADAVNKAAALVDWHDRMLAAESECARLRAQLQEAEEKIEAVRAVVADIPESVFTAAEVGMLDEEYAIEAVGDLRIIRALLTPATSPGAGEGTLCGVTAWNRWSLPCDREPGHTGTHSHDPTPGRSGK